jgi:hypothetical protein
VIEFIVDVELSIVSWSDVCPGFKVSGRYWEGIRCVIGIVNFGDVVTGAVALHLLNLEVDES